MSPVALSFLLLLAAEVAAAVALLPAARRRGGAGRPWALLSATAAAIAVGRVLTEIDDHGGAGLSGTRGSAGGIGGDDFVYLAAGWLFVGALVSFWRRQRRRLDRWDLLDAALVTGCLALAVWVHVMAPMLATATTWPQRVLAVAVPLQSLVVLALTLVVVGHHRLDRPQVVLFASVALLVGGGVVASAESDVAWPWQLLAPAGYALWVLLAYAGWARALTEPALPEEAGPPAVRRVGVLVAAAFSLNLAVVLPDEGRTLLVPALSTMAVVAGRALVLTNRLRRAYDTQLAEAKGERRLARVALRLVEADSPAAVHRTATEGAVEVLEGLAPVAVALAVGRPDDLSVVAMHGEVGLAAAVNVDEVLAENRARLDRDPVATRCGRGLLVPVVGRSGPLGVLAVLAPGSRLDDRASALAQVAAQTAVALESLAVSARGTGGRPAPAPFVLAMAGPLPTDHSVTDLHRGMRAGEIRGEFQPIVRLSDRVTVGYEALARWQHPERGTVAPGRFLGTAIDSGLIVPLGRQLLTQVVVTAARLPLGVRELSVAVNLSAAELRAPGLMDVLRTLLVANAVAPGRLVVEVTENAVLEDVDVVSSVLADLRSLGVKVHLDDFGTGYSSLSWLRELPLDGIKVDRSFVADLGVVGPSSGTTAAPVVEAITRMAQVLDLTVVAEGVESACQADVLQRLGCHLGQGWALGRPAPLDLSAVERVLVPTGVPALSQRSG